MRQVLITTLAAGLLAGCSTLHFTTNEPIQTAPERSVWHHNAALSLMEVSAPVDLNQRCAGQGWQNVKTELSLANGLAGAVDNAVIGVNLWEPWTVSYICTP